MQRLKQFFEYWPYLFIGVSILGFIYIAVRR